MAIILEIKSIEAVDVQTNCLTNIHQVHCVRQSLRPWGNQSYLYLIKRKTAVEFQNNAVKSEEAGDRWYIGYANLVFL